MITVNDVYYSYSSKQQRVDVLKGVTCAFEPGTIYAVQGPSGSGKSTLLSLLARLDKPLSGDILWDDRSISLIPGDEYRRVYVAMVFQAFCLLPYATALENVAYPALLQGKKTDDGEAEKCLESVGIGKEFFRRLPHALSGGEQQRVAIARALCSRAAVILADEPTGNLDRENAKNIWDILCALARKEGKMVIVATHDSELAETSDVRLSLRDGVLVS